MPTVRGACRRCGVVKSLAGRGLCKWCHQHHKHEYPKPSYERWVGGNPPPRLPAEPTDALPGSAAKLAVMAARAEAGFALHHPDDAGAVTGAELVRLLDWLRRAG